MEALFGLLAVAAAVGWLAHRLFSSRPSSRRPVDVSRATERHRRQLMELQRRRQLVDQQQRRRRIVMLARSFQVPLLQLDRAPDFRRAAAAACAAREVPAEFRQRQFVRFRPQLVQRFADRMAEGADAAELHNSLRTLVTALGVANFEADYIRDQAVGLSQRDRQPQTCAQRVAELEREHQARLAAINTGLNRNAGDLREQLVEAEERRHRDALLAVFDQPGPAEPEPPPPA
jgi:hypothetical protein